MTKRKEENSISLVLASLIRRNSILMLQENQWESMRNKNLKKVSDSIMKFLEESLFISFMK